MALPKKQQPMPNGLIASALRLPAVKPHLTATAQGWQADAWIHYSTLGEARFVANWVGNMMSRAELVAIEQTPDGYVPVEEGPAKEALDAYYGGRNGQAEMLQQTGVNLTVAGEGYHCMLGKEQQWLVLSSGKVSQQGQGKDATVYAQVGSDRVKVAKSDIVIRVWTPHPANVDQADSPMRSNMTILTEIQQLNQHVQSQLSSRLTGAGILFLPSEIQFAVPEGVDPQSNQADAFMQVLGETMATGIKDRASAAAMVPIVVTAPADSLGAIKHMTFWTELDSETIAMREHAVRRFALGMDTPPEVLLGIGDSNHWNSWLIDESSIKAHLEPRLQVVVNAVTTGYLRPAITGMVPNPEAFSVAADTSKIRMRPNRSTEAIELYDRGELNGTVLRRETGFQPTDGLTDEQTILWLLRKIATGSTSPEQTVAALKELGVDITDTVGQIQSPINREPGDAQRTDARRQVRDQRQPDIRRSVDEKAERDGLTAACDVLVYRALERIGNRLGNGTPRGQQSTYAVCKRYLSIEGRGANPDRLLEGTWEFAEEALSSYHSQPAAVVSALDIYVRGLLITQTEHTRKGLVAALTQLEVAA